MTDKLAILTQAERRIARLSTIPEVRALDGELDALERFARARQWPLPEQNRLVLARALVLRRGGELVQEIPKAPPEGGPRRKGKGLTPTLGANKIALSVAQRWVSLAQVAKATIRAAIAKRTDAGQSVTLGYLYGLARPPIPVETPPHFPSGPFRTLVIDPPWPISKIGLERRDEERSSMDYAIATLKHIRDLPIRKLADARGAHVYLWVTHRFLPYGLRLFRAWGVRYECVLTWIKPTAQPLWWAYTTEHILFGKVKSLAPIVKGLPVSFTAPQQRHSHKPDDFFDLVRKVSPEPRLTMYDDTREGFKAWGIVHHAG